MNRRDFVSRVTLGAAAACTGIASPSFASPTRSASTKIRFVGMMGFIQRTDQSLLVATPGQSHHMTHVPFLMARAGSPVAGALGLRPARGVVPEAFDTALMGTKSSDFVYRSLNNLAIDVTSGRDDAVVNEATEMAEMNRIAPGKRIRGNVANWASSTISLRGGHLQNSSGHPDAGKVWTFGSHRQRLTDAVNFNNRTGDATTIRLTGATEALNYTAQAGEDLELWVFSAAAWSARGGDRTRLAHSHLLFEYLVDATPVVAECPDATGRVVPPTELPFVQPSGAALGARVTGSAFPPETEFCFLAIFLGMGG